VATDELRSRVAHLHRRLGFGARPDELDAAVAAGYDATVERLLDLGAADAADRLAPPAFSPPLLPSQLPADAGERRTVQQQEQRKQRAEGQALGLWWVQRMASSTVPLRERLALFWHDHFATSVQKVREPELMYAQNQVFRTQGAGDFEALTQALARDPAMLIWLDSNQNRRQSPNENFARELFELFTLGIGAYTEADVKDGARAFTGWQFLPRQAREFRIVPTLHDNGVKTVLGTTGNLGGEDVVRLATRHPASPAFVAAKLFSRFARPVGVDAPVVRELAAGFARDRDVGRLVRAMVRHPEFTAPASRSGLVKEPVVYVAGALRALDVRADARGLNLMNSLNTLGQVPFNPPNVGGWPQNGYWLTTSFALSRLRFAATVVARADLRPVSSVGAAERPAAAARLLSVDGWGPATGAALAKAAPDPQAMMTLALVAPEHLLA